jgi:acetylornithine/N-succinyldiaminopimelate aminotransferase
MSTTAFEVPPKPATATSDVAQTAQTSEEIEHQIDEKKLHSLVEADAEVGIQNYGRLAIGFVRGRGARLWDHAGKEYLDFLGGIAVVTVGHCHPAVTEAITRQANTLLHSSNIYYIEPQVQLAQKLHGLSGGMRAFFCNSGAEANEAALKIARKYFSDRGRAGDDKRREIITTFDSFHGRTYAALAATGQPKYHEGFAPMPTGFKYVPLNDIEAMRAAVDENTAAIMLEPIQGESGVRPADDKYLQDVRALCDEHGILLILDEVQCGIGRTGKFFGWEHSGARPDIVTLAKGLGNGVPIGAMLASEEVAASFVPGTHGSTFGGNFLSSAAALATLQVLEDENLMQHATEIGAYFSQKLKAWGEENGLVSQVRGRGLMIGVQLSQPIARDLMKASLERGLIFNAVGTDVLRFLPPYCITESDVDEAIKTLEAARQSLSE